jgi:hypothetical protein
MIIAIYRWLLKLYPQSFRAEIGSEMEAVFASMYSDALKHGRLTAIGALFREMITIPTAAFREHMKGQGIRMPQDGSGVVPLPWPKVLLAILPGLIFIFPILGHVGIDPWQAVLIASVLPVVIGFIWERRITVWGLPGIGILLGMLYMQISWSDSMFLVPTGIVIIVLIGLTMQRRAEMLSTWIIFTTMILVAFATGLSQIILSGDLQGVLNGRIFAIQLYYDMFSIVSGLGITSLYVISGLPFARHFGSSALLVMLGVLSLLSIGLSIDGESMGLGQWLEEAMPFVLSLILMILLPLLVYRARSLNARLLGVLIPLLIAIIGSSLVTGVFYRLQWWAWLVNLGSVIEILLGLLLAFLLYDQLGHSFPLHKKQTSSYWLRGDRT